MLLSMTGFASKTFPFIINGESISLTISLKTLNSRFFEANCKIPYVLIPYEYVIQKKLKENLSRGSVQCSINLSSLAAFAGSVQPSLRTVEAYLTSIEKINATFGSRFPISNTVDIKDIIQLPFVFEQPETLLDAQALGQIETCLDLIIKDLIAERQREGSVLQKDLEGRINILKTTIEQIAIRSKSVLQARRDKLLKDTLELLKDATSEAQEHHMQQLHVQLDKMDIHEELVRFNAHLANFELVIKSDSLEKGKKFDFILQELFRETNTIASKCLDAELSSLTIIIKVELEKAREQAQNIV